MQFYHVIRRWVVYRLHALAEAVFVPGSSRRAATQQRHRQLDRMIAGLERRSARR